MITQDLKFDKLSNVKLIHPSQKEDEPDILTVKNNGIQCKRAFTNNELNMLYNMTIVGEGDTVIASATNATDWDNGKYSFVNNPSDAQVISSELASGEEFYLANMKINCVLEDDEEITDDVSVEISSDGINYVKLKTEISDNTILAYTDVLEGLYCKYIQITTNGTNKDEGKIVISDITAFKKGYKNPHIIIEHVDKWIASTFAGMTETITTGSDSDVKYQVTMSGKAYYYDAVATAWKQVQIDNDMDYLHSNTATEITTKAATFPITEESILGLRIILFSTEDETPAIEEVSFS
jgi:hypothetical protein